MIIQKGEQMQVNNFQHIPGKNDTEYIELLKDALGRQKIITSKAIAKLKEQPKVIRCKNCKYYGRADKRRFYRGSDCLMGRIATIIPDRDFCSRAERRTDGENISKQKCRF